MESERMTTGRALLASLSPNAEAALHAALDDIAPDMVEMVVAFGYGDIHARPGLATADRQVGTIAALAALATPSRERGLSRSTPGSPPGSPRAKSWRRCT